MQTWNENGIEEPLDLPPGAKPLTGWHYDETIFYAHDCCESQWVHKDTTPKPYAKGEGPSIMDINLVSPEYGFCCSPDGSERAQVIFKLGKACNGYFENNDILNQMMKAMDICEKFYPDDEHLFIFDNVMTHLKQADDAPSALKMPKNTPKPGTNWGVDVPSHLIKL